MKQLRATNGFAFLLVWVVLAGISQAQHWYHYAPPPTEFDWELFAPLSEYDLSGDGAPAAGEGYFFSASRMHFWASRPTRTVIGNPSASPNVAYIPNGVAQGYFAALAPLDGADNPIFFLQAGSDGGSFGLQFSSVSDAVPDSVTGWGNRFEVGWVQSDTIHDSAAKTGWMLTVLSGIDMNESYFIGFDDKRLNQLDGIQGGNGTDAIDGLPDLTPLDGVDDSLAPFGQQDSLVFINGIPAQEGHTTVHVNFADPFDLLLGFTDTNADQVADDLDGDGVITSGDFFGTGVGDQARLAVVFDDLEFHNQTEVSGVELLALRRKKKLHGNAAAEMFLGARFLEVDDTFRATGRGGILTDSNWSNNALNRIVGPEFGLRVVKRSRRWSTTLSGRFMAGANLLNIRQQGTLGDHAATGVTGATTPGIPTSFGGADFINRLRDERFSPVGEFRFQTAFNVTRGVKLKAGWEGMIVGGLARGSNTIAYSLPTLGILDRSEELFTHGVSFGLEVNR